MITKHDGNYHKARYNHTIDAYNDESYCESSESCLDDNFDPKDDNLSAIPSKFHRDPYANARSSHNNHIINKLASRSIPPSASIQRNSRPYDQAGNKLLQSTVNRVEASTPVDGLHDGRTHHGQHQRSHGRQPVHIEMTNMRSSQPKPSSVSDLTDTVDV